MFYFYFNVLYTVILLTPTFFLIEIEINSKQIYSKHNINKLFIKF